MKRVQLIGLDFGSTTSSAVIANRETVREAARAVLSDLTLKHLYDHPLR